MDVAQLCDYVDMDRMTHRVDSAAGKKIITNSTIFRRERLLYTDFEGYEDEGASWSNPSNLLLPLSSLGWMPTVNAEVIFPSEQFSIAIETIRHLPPFSGAHLQDHSI